MNESRDVTRAMRARGWGRPRGRWARVALWAALALTARSGTSRAESPFSGKWKQAPLREEFTVQTWNAGCGPSPVSGATGGGESVIVHEEGDELVFVGGGRTFRTNQCYDQLPTLAREAHTRDASGRMWRTRCATPQGDPRHAVMNTLIAATSDGRIELTETGRYEIVLAEGRCIADVKRSRVFEAIQVVAAAASAPPPPVAPAPTPKIAPPPPEAPKGACASPGEPARLEVRPSRKLLRTGESFLFHAIVRDATGCVTRTSTTWALAPSADGMPRGNVDAAGRVTISDDAQEGVLELVATAAGKSTRIRIEVTSAAHYDELLAQSGLNAAGENDTASVVVLETESIGGRDVQAEDGARRRRNIFIVVVGAIVALLGSLAIVGARRARKAERIEAELEEQHDQQVREVEAKRRARADEHAAQVRAHEESVQRAQLAVDSARKRQAESSKAAASPLRPEMVCSACRREYPATSAYCPQDGAKLVPLPAEHVLASPAGVVCPTCKRGFAAGTRNCPFDKDELVPYAMVGPSASSMALPARGKICPTCGGRFDGSATFCGKDGTALVLLN